MKANHKVSLNNCIIGESRPKICVPFMGNTIEEIITSAREVCNNKPDIMEWRVDFYKDSDDTERVIEVLNKLHTLIHNIPILFTFRTKAEGGEKAIDDLQYSNLNEAVAKSGLVDMIDVELYSNMVEDTVHKIKKCGISVIISNHDFNSTPDEMEMLRRLQKMEQLGADIAKIAVMPRDKRDVIRLLSVTEQANRELICPVVTMSMSSLGVISRLAGEVFGSAITFGSVGKNSAPGQVPIEELRNMLELIHNYTS